MWIISINGINYKVLDGTKLSDALIIYGELEPTAMTCGGKGICKNCKVLVEQTNGEYVSILSCQEYVTSDMIIKTLRKKHYSDVVSIDINSVAKLALAVDIGTTTIVMEFVDISTGEAIAQRITSNPQIKYSADVMARAEAVSRGKDLRTEIVEIIKEYLADYKVQKIAIIANTIMQHILVEADIEGLLSFPFTAVKKYNKISIDKQLTEYLGAEVEIMPYVGAFYGADALMGIVATNYRVQTSIFVDLGTNSEIALVHNDKIYCTASAGGSASVGGYMASEVLEAAAQGLSLGIIDRSGSIETESIEPNYIALTRVDIRAIQLMKAAIATGITFLLEKAGISYEQVEKIYISGLIGKVVSSKTLRELKIIKNNTADIVSLPYAGLSGTRDYISKKIDENVINDIINRCTYYNMAEDASFMDLYVSNMGF